MRKIEKSMIEAIESGRTWTGANTSVVHKLDGHNRAAHVYLHGNHIATVRYNRDEVLEVGVTAAGWHTRTTASRLHAIVSHFYPGEGFVGIHQGVIRASTRGSKRPAEIVKLDHLAALFYRNYAGDLRVQGCFI